MKISLITITESVNYGAVWQSFALYKFIRNINKDTEMINYNPSYAKTTDIRYLKEKMQLILLNKRIKKCNSFKKKNIQFTDYEYKNIKVLKEKPPISDLYIVGSDQVWNSDISNGLDPAFFLQFVKKGKKISYASSIGKDKVAQEDMSLMKEYLNSFNDISVRETSAKNLLTNSGVKDVKQVLDPVFLLDKEEYIKMSSDFKKDNYLLIYGFDSNKKINEVAKLIAKEKKLTIIEIGGARKKYESDVFLRNLSPEEFLGIINNAKYIVTSSFHGTAFSIIFDKDFISVLPPQRGTRIESILNLLKLEDRLIKESDKIILKGLLEAPNYCESKKILSEEVKKSRNYLIKNILPKDLKEN